MIKYLPERIHITGIGSVINGTKVRDTDRYYWVSKMAKDLIILTKQDHYTFSDIEGFFRDRVFTNYLNEM